MEDDSPAINLTTAIAKLNKASTLLFRILSVLRNEWRPDAKLPELTTDDLDKSILDAFTAIQDLIDKYDTAKALEDPQNGVIHKLGMRVKSVCVDIKPFLKTFLKVAAGGANVYVPNRPRAHSRFPFLILLGCCAVECRYL